MVFSPKTSLGQIKGEMLKVAIAQGYDLPQKPPSETQAGAEMNSGFCEENDVLYGIPQVGAVKVSGSHCQLGSLSSRRSLSFEAF